MLKLPHNCTHLAPHSTTLAWKTPWTEEPGRLQSMGSLSQTRLSDFTFTFHFHALEKEMATHSSVLAWRIPGTKEPGRRLSMGSNRVGHNWSDLAAAAAYMFQCHSPKSSHPLPLPQSPKDCSIHQCLFCCLVYRVIVTIFLNSIYMR